MTNEVNSLSIRMYLFANEKQAYQLRFFAIIAKLRISAFSKQTKVSDPLLVVLSKNRLFGSFFEGT